MNKNLAISHSIAILKILQKYSDKNHPLTQEMIIEYLEQDFRIILERKAIARNIIKITNSGYDIKKAKKIKSNNFKGGYYLNAKDELSDSQWRIIISAINAAGFVSESETKKMNKKIAKYVNIYQAQNLHANTIINSNKSANNNVLENINKIVDAISNHHSIKFNYIDYFLNGTKHYKASNIKRHLIPCVTNWENDRFYLIGYLANDDIRFNENDKIRIFRVDKMEEIIILEDKVDNSFKGMEHYGDNKIGAFAGEKRLIKAICNEQGLSQILDRFDPVIDEIKIKNRNDTNYLFEISFNVEESPVFYGWLFSQNTNIKIISNKIKDKYIDKLRKIIQEYD